MSTEALQWFKSTYSSDEGGQCLEVALAWRKSSYSSDEGGACVEVAECPGTIHIRDSKNPESASPTLQLTPASWAAFTTEL
ncbi:MULTISPECIES: DUF397 domain-containing protein [unclassified Streptomyces]|uniref:DUF397 domain-containing protein n=1 Tax=unclassified Streptomyces TaxID=2593676 RepID=UPI000DD93A82|nr:MULTISPECIES: DUF397 domain-containing protein [unclassified Streptomyces]QZZ29441.1 DUF397 domain-containing protein [Streptomyces sp. ST1015]